MSQSIIQHVKMVNNNTLQDNSIGKIVFPIQAMLGNIIYGLRAVKQQQQAEALMKDLMTNNQMFCIQCGQILPVGAQYCCKCGTRVQTSINETADLIAEKAEEMTIGDDEGVYNDANTADDVSSKAIFVGFESQPIIESPIITPTTSLEPQYPQRQVIEIESNNDIVLIEEKVSESAYRYYYEDCTSGSRTDYFHSSEIITDDYSYILINVYNKKYRFFFHNRKQHLFERVLPQTDEYEKVQVIWKKGVDYAAILVRKLNLYGLIIYDSKAQNSLFHITPCDYKNIKVSTDGIIVELNGKCGLVFYDRSRHLFDIIPCIYDDLALSERYIIFKQDGKYGLMNRSQFLILSCEFDEIESFKCGFRVKKNNKYGFLLFVEGGLIPVPCIFDQLSSGVRINHELRYYFEVLYNNKKMLYAVNGKLYHDKGIYNRTRQELRGVSFYFILLGLLYFVIFRWGNDFRQILLPLLVVIFPIAMLLWLWIWYRHIMREEARYKQYEFVTALNMDAIWANFLLKQSL